MDTYTPPYIYMYIYIYIYIFRERERERERIIFTKCTVSAGKSSLSNSPSVFFFCSQTKKKKKLKAANFSRYYCICRFVDASSSWCFYAHIIIFTGLIQAKALSKIYFIKQLYAAYKQKNKKTTNIFYQAPYIQHRNIYITKQQIHFIKQLYATCKQINNETTQS